MSDEGKQIDLDWENTMKHRSGRAVLWDIMDEYLMMDDIETTDPLKAQRQLGQRDVTLYIYRKFMEHCPEMFIQMQQEILNERTK